MQGALHQSVLLEYLASHGFVVLSISTYNSAPAFYGRGDETVDGLLNLTEDLALALTQARAMPFADTDRAAAIGMLAYGGMALQMKAQPLRAIACVECLGYADLLRQLPFYDTRRLRVPLLEVINSTYDGADTGQNHSILESFVSAARYVARLKGVDGMPADFLRVRELPASPPTPTEAEFLEWLRYGRMAQARAAWSTHGAALVNRSRMFTTVLFLARDREPHAGEAVAMFRNAFPAAPDTTEARQDALLSRLLATR